METREPAPARLLCFALGVRAAGVKQPLDIPRLETMRKLLSEPTEGATALQISARLRFFSQKCISRVDDSFLVAILLTPLETGSQQRKPNGVVFLHILGLQIGTQFCPDLMDGNVIRVGRQGWVFL